MDPQMLAQMLMQRQQPQTGMAGAAGGIGEMIQKMMVARALQGQQANRYFPPNGNVASGTQANDALAGAGFGSPQMQPQMPQ